MNRIRESSAMGYPAIVRGLVALCVSMAANVANAEEAVIFSYTRTSTSNASYMLMPQVVEASPLAPAQIFDALRRRKLPTYGSTQYDEKKNVVSIDETKCGYSAIISAEIDGSFAYHGFRLPEFSCMSSRVESAHGQLTHYAVVLPLWQALDPKVDAPAGSLVQIGDDYVTLKAFRERVAKRDKSAMQAIDADLSSGAGFVRSGVMRGMLLNHFPGAEKRIAKELESKDPVSVNAALEALLPLSGSKLDKSVCEKMGRIIEEPSPHQVARATAALGATSKDLRSRALSVLFRSEGDAAIRLAQSSYAKLDRSERVEFFRQYGEKILTEAPSSHVAAIVELMHAAEQQTSLATWLEMENATPNALTAAEWLSENGNGALLSTALSVLLESDDDVAPYDAWDRLMAQEASSRRLSDIARGLNSPHALIRHWAFRAIESSQAVCREVVAAVARASRSGSMRFSGEYAPMIAALYGAKCHGDDLEGVEPASLRKRAIEAGRESTPGDMRASGALLALARLDASRALEVLANNAYDADVSVRRDVAYALRWMGRNGDSLRASMLRDSDESVVLNALWGLGQLDKDALSVAMSKEIISRSKQSTGLRIVAMQMMAIKAGGKNSQTISTYIGNEMFDANVDVKIAAIRALSEIARNVAEPLMRENAMSSLALMAQDVSPVIVFHTLRGLSAAEAPGIDNLLSSAQKNHPEVYRRIIRLRGR